MIMKLGAGLMLIMHPSIAMVPCSYAQHVHRWWWQAQVFSNKLEMLKDYGHIAIAMDFAENYTILEPIEVQTQYFSNRQIVVLVMIVYRRVPASDHVVSDSSADDDDDDDGSGDIIATEQYFFISEDTRKGCEFVHHCIIKLLNYWRNELERPNPSHIHTWSDGCAGDFKSRHAFLDKAMLWLQIAADAPPGSPVTMVTCNFFESGHGKGSWDGAGGWFKNTQQIAGIAGEHGQGLRRTLADIADLVNKEHATPKQSLYKSRNDERMLVSRHCFVIEADEVCYSMTEVK